MAHIARSAAIFSPSVARIAVSTAKDWNYVDSWLAAKFHGRSPPAFERNQDTLKALLALAALNETADEERDLLARVEASAVQELAQSAAEDEAPSNVREEVLDALQDALSSEGQAALDAMAAAAVELGIAHPEPEGLGCGMVELHGQALELEQAVARVGTLQRFLEAESRKAQALLRELEGESFRPAEHLAKQNLEMQRRTKAAAARLRERKDKMASVPSPAITIGRVRNDEQDYLALLSQKRQLDDEIRSFQGLPPDKDLARPELEALRSELRSITQRRDAIFEGLVERESPRKRS